ncbi:MAG: VOC family protein [Actinomycetota bacterium]|nr:VOC family protein [Actinomycetota bacterium]
MGIKLNHTIVASRDKAVSARFVAEVLGLPAPTTFGPFAVVQVDNEVSLDFLDAPEPITPQHYAFLVDDEEFDAIFGRIRARGVSFWADPHREQPNEINHHFGGRGVYFDDPNGHLLEAITAPYTE